MDLEIAIQTKVSQKEKNKYCTLTHTWRVLKTGMIILFAKQKQRHMQRTHGYQGGMVGDGGRVNWEVEIDIYINAMYKTDN